MPLLHRNLDELVDYLLKNAIKDKDCLLYHNYVERNGYARVQIYHKRILVHRVIAIKFLGLNNDGTDIQVCHTCDIRHCINPKHLFLGNNSSNQKDKVRKKPGYRYWGINESRHVRKDVVSI